MYLISLIVHAILGLAITAWILWENRALYRAKPDGKRTGAVEIAYWTIDIASVLLGWYFNIRFVLEYHSDDSNSLWGNGSSWSHYIELMFGNWAADSASQDYTLLNVAILPLMSISGGLRKGLPKPWLFFVDSLFTSAVFGFVLYLITADRHTMSNPRRGR
ncbi:DUF2834 domain-containing protein [Nocardia sp. ET3-3]|uniref:DUF2834 domain-containing protein n=1 Tax=Nocardia terrae TaxID=2675851 RepID=A0A7K1V4T9_9NOCA|nr:DUF2834 domain-containing protein [Nocardia terrae]MVU81670.1 DUF2834 domain-containing protein [Nocardia terrae]